MAKIKLPYVAWREGRPRFVPGVRERAMGFKGQDLKHEDGRWFSLDEAHGFAIARQAEIQAQRKTGRKLKSPPVPRGRAVKDLWEAYKRSDKFKGNPERKVKGLAPSSQRTYKHWIKPLESEAAWLAPVGSLDPIILKAIHERVMHGHGLGMANGMMAALSAALTWGRLHGWLPRINGRVVESPATDLDLPSLQPRVRVADEEQIVALLEASDRIVVAGVPLSAIGDAVATGLFSGQREKDVLDFVPGEQSNSRIELVQSKTKARVSIPMAPRLVERIAAGRSRRARLQVQAQNIVINERTGLRYNEQTFRQHFNLVRTEAAKECKAVADLRFSDLRDTAVTWYARAGCTVPEIASITGHSLASIYTILKHYLALDEHLADNAVRKLVEYMEREGMAL